MLAFSKGVLAFLLYASWLALGETREIVRKNTPQGKPRPLSLLECVTAGDYRWIEISAEGEVEALRAGRRLRVFDYRRGRLSSSDLRTLHDLWGAAGLQRLPRFLPLQPEEGVVTEDRYFFLGDGESSRNLVAHELTLPRSVSPLVHAMQDVARRLPKITLDHPDSARIVALPVEMLICLGEDAPRADQSSGSGTSRAYLERALRRAGRSVIIAPADVTDVERRLFTGTSLLRIGHEGREYAVLLFRSQARTEPQ